MNWEAGVGANWECKYVLRGGGWSELGMYWKAGFGANWE